MTDRDIAFVSLDMSAFACQAMHRVYTGNAQISLIKATFELNRVPQDDVLRGIPPAVIVNVTLFGKRTFADIMS